MFTPSGRLYRGGSTYNIVHLDGTPRIEINGGKDFAAGALTYGLGEYKSQAGRKVMMAFPTGKVRSMEPQLKGIGLGTLMLKIAENNCLAAHKSIKPFEKLFIGGNTRYISALCLFLANGYKLTAESWRELSMSGISKKFPIEFREGNEAVLRKHLKVISKTDYLGGSFASVIVNFYKEMKKPNKLPAGFR